MTCSRGSSVTEASSLLAAAPSVLGFSCTGASLLAGWDWDFWSSSFWKSPDLSPVLPVLGAIPWAAMAWYIAMTMFVCSMFLTPP